MNLYHYRPLSDEIYRVPILIVMATTNRGYILDMVPGQSFIETPSDLIADIEQALNAARP